MKVLMLNGSPHKDGNTAYGAQAVRCAGAHPVCSAFTFYRKVYKRLRCMMF